MFDKRNRDKVALMTEFNSEMSFAETTNIWTDQPYIIGSKEVKQHNNNNSVIYHLSRQKTVVHIISEYDITLNKCKTTFRFFEDHSPFKELAESETTHQTKGKRARATMVKDLRTETDYIQMNAFRIIIDGKYEDTMLIDNQL